MIANTFSNKNPLDATWHPWATPTIKDGVQQGYHLLSLVTKTVHNHYKCITRYSKTRDYRGIPNFLIFDPKHRLWVLVRTAPVSRFYLGSNIKLFWIRGSTEQKQEKYQTLSTENFQFLQLAKNLYNIH